MQTSDPFESWSDSLIDSCAPTLAQALLDCGFAVTKVPNCFYRIIPNPNGQSGYAKDCYIYCITL